MLLSKGNAMLSGAASQGYIPMMIQNAWTAKNLQQSYFNIAANPETTPKLNIKGEMIYYDVVLAHGGSCYASAGKRNRALSESYHY